MLSLNKTLNTKPFVSKKHVPVHKNHHYEYDCDYNIIIVIVCVMAFKLYYVVYLVPKQEDHIRSLHI